MNNVVRFVPPASCTRRNIKYILKSMEAIFKFPNKSVPNAHFVVKQVKEVDVLGQLLIYKFLNYTVNKSCFINPSSDLRGNYYLVKELKKTGFRELINDCFQKKDPEEDDFKYKEQDGVFISPIVLTRDSKGDKISNDNRLKISSYYSYNHLISFAILQCLCEISSNFKEHAVEDTNSIIVAQGNKKHFEIACADNGDGIIKTLGKVQERMPTPFYSLLERSIEKGVSSKLSEGHMGRGLWLINEFVTHCMGYLIIFSNRGYLQNTAGKIKCGEAPNWQGTIIYVDIPLNNPMAIMSVMKNK